MTDPRGRSRRLYDRWSDPDWLYPLVERATARSRRRAVERLGLGHSERVLEVGCGPGVNLEALSRAVGPDGHVVAVDLSPGMVSRARGRIRERELSNVSVVRGDATALPVAPERFDAALSTIAMSTMPDADAVARQVRAALRPGGRFAVLDARPFRSGPFRVLNPLLREEARLLVDWTPDPDVQTALANAFDHATVRESLWGAWYLALARRHS